MTYEQMRQIYGDILDGLPAGIFDRLNGGVILSEQHELHPKSLLPDLYVAGKYVVDPRGLGRYIVLYYGSLKRLILGMPYQAQVEKLKEVLYHELTHHLEHLAGERTLDVQDEVRLRDYLNRHQK